MVQFSPNSKNISKITINPSTFILEYNGRPVSVVYYRDGFNLKHYHDGDTKLTKLRKIAEKSMSICIPTLRGQILGFKIFQKFMLVPEFQDLVGFRPEEISMIQRHSADILNLNFDFEGKKEKMLEFVEANPDKSSFFII